MNTHRSELTTFADWFGGHVPDPKTGVVGSSRLTLTEYLCSGLDIRRYTVTQTSFAGNVIRQQVFTADSYLGTRENMCGSREASQARALLREWHDEGWRSFYAEQVTS